MMYSLTVFKSPRWWEAQQRYVYDNKTHRRMDFDSWDKFEKFLYKLSERELESKQNAELITPAVFEPGTNRSNKTVTAWAGWAAVDVDDYVVEGDLKDVLHAKFGAWNYVCYSTASSTIAQPKFRLVFPLTGPVEAERIRHFWFALNSELDSIGDKQTKDLSRMYYIPATYAGSNNFIFSNHGKHVDPDALCAKWHFDERKSSAANFLDRLPDAWRDQVIQHRKDQLNNTSVNWTGYHDCPFWPKRQASEYMMIAEGGWYRKMYQIMVALAGNAIKKEYPITPKQIADMCRQFDMDHGKWYENRPLEREADSALEYVYKNS
jgi:hypothetical protein